MGKMTAEMALMNKDALPRLAVKISFVVTVDSASRRPGYVIQIPTAQMDQMSEIVIGT